MPLPGLIVQEWIEPTGGAERVLDEMVRTFPDADLWALWNDAPHRFPGTRVGESWLTRTPLRGKKALALPLMSPTWRRIPPPDGRPDGAPDFLLSSSYVFAHHARVWSRPEIPRFAYVHTPARYLWAPEHDVRGSHRAVRAAAVPLKTMDRRRAQDPDIAYAANSRFIAERIRRAWGVEAQVIYPPVDVARLTAEPDWSARVEGDEQAVLDRLPEQFVLGASRFVAYKRHDQVIAAGEAVGLPVVLAGSGPEEANLRRRTEDARVPLHLVIAPSDALLAALIQRATVFVFPPVEDFGIMPVEAMALGTPVVVNGRGGAAESVLDGVTGVHVRSFDDRTAVASAIQHAASLDRATAVTRADGFSAERFRAQLREWVAPANR